MKHNLIFLFICFIFFSCQESKSLEDLSYEVVKTDWKINKVNNTTVYQKIDMTPFTGKISENTYEGEFINGLKSGVHREFENGKLSFEGKYIDGIPVEVHKNWNDDQLIMIKEYKDGKRFGLSRKWNLKGELSKIDYDENKLLKYLKDYLNNNDDLNSIEGEYVMYKYHSIPKENHYNNRKLNEHIIKKIDNEFYAIITYDESNELIIGSIQAVFKSTGDKNIFDANWKMSDGSISSFTAEINDNHISFKNESLKLFKK